MFTLTTPLSVFPKSQAVGPTDVVQSWVQPSIKWQRV